MTTLTYPSLDHFLDYVEGAQGEKDDTPDIGAAEAYLLCLLFRWGAEDEGQTDDVAQLNEQLALINSVLTDEERLGALQHLIAWGDQPADSWLQSRTIVI